MSYHHLAMAARDMGEIHRFYEELMGFELVKVEIDSVPGGGWAKHFFYRMQNDDAFIAFWELHDVPAASQFETSLSKAAGLPDHINHIAFGVADMAELAQRKECWLEAGLDVLEIDHSWCHSIYTKDPNDNLVEFCLTTGTFSQVDRDRALAALTADDLDFSQAPAAIDFHTAGGQ